MASAPLCLQPSVPNSAIPMNLPLPAETLLLEGADAPAFAHTQFSSAVKSLAVDRWQFSAWLDPRGRVLALFHLARLADDRYLLLLRGGSAAVMAEALRRFVFRSKVRITALPPRHLSSGPALAQGSLLTGPTSDDDGDVSFGCDSHSLRVTSVGGIRSGKSSTKIFSGALRTCAGSLTTSVFGWMRSSRCVVVM